ncbi:hypothetical protein EBQ24_08775 [Allofranklinella schreckenbergeri]|uniref:Uncharacterized protein n=1 Tax=Allofranklinella schreckenbergeri TaxID=1076744 RepID=A0A3M6QWM2_9BURK|nr:hypothetical protein [Allofranklinella schreckenbergeri]RMX07420.1 hypothetical protein EBQ24_08775 [Allofranklinella schreckenbergeri]
MTMEAQIINLAQTIGADIKAIHLKQGDLSALPTTAKASLVAALTELHTAMQQLSASAGAQIDDSAGTGVMDKTWSANKLVAAIDAAKLAVKNELTDGAGAALDTLKELAEALGGDANFSQTIAADIAKRVRYDQAQVLSQEQQKQACANIGVGDPTHSFVADYNAAKA